MTYVPPPTGRPTPMTISSMTEDLVGIGATAGQTGASAVWPAAALALFFPIPISDVPRTYTKAWWVNGATAAGNVDVGIYTISGTTGTRVVASTAQAQTGASVLQVATTFTSTTLSAGVQYYIAMSCSLGTATAWRIGPSSTLTRLAGCFQMATAHPLPASATVAVSANGYVPVFGFSENANV